MTMQLKWSRWILVFLAVGFSRINELAAQVTWVGGNGVWSDGSANDANWNPADEPDIDDEAIFNTANSVSLGSANTVEALTMSGGIDVSASGFGLTVDGLAQLIDAGTNLNIQGEGSALIADSVTINSGGAIRLFGLLNVSEESGDGLVDINSGGTISGSGAINLADPLTAPTTLLINDGTISALAPAPFPGAAPLTRTLVINASDDTDALVDLDGSAGNGILQVNRNQTLDINVRVNDAFSGEINLFHNSRLDVSTAWSLDGTIEVETGFVNGGLPNPDIPADVARISGAEFTQSGGTITVIDLDGTLQFDAPFLMNGGTLVNNGLVIFNANTNIAAAANFSMPTGSSSIAVGEDAVVNIDQANFDPDGAGSATNVLTIDRNGVLDLDLGAGADESLGGFIQLNGGELDVTTADSDWSIAGNVSVGEDSGTSQINGEEVDFTTAAVVVGESATLEVNAANVWESQSSLEIAPGGAVRLNGVTNINGGSITGGGTLRTAGISTFDAVTTVNMPSGTVILDGDDAVGGNVTINADTTINAGTMADFGNDNVIGFNTLVLNDVADLTVNLTDIDAEWTLTAEGRLDINASTTAMQGSGIHGSAFNMAGMATISGDSFWDARTDISGTVTIAAGGSLNLNGNPSHDQANRLDGGTITGDGALRSQTDKALFGFGTIAADIDLGEGTLRADDGTLTVTGEILGIGSFGTADTDGILNRPAAWNTAANIGTVFMLGGELRGGTITNDNGDGINGVGLVSARVINNSRIDAQGDGTLVLETALNDNDWDGTTNDGSLNAISADLEIRDNASFAFHGTISALQGQVVFANGFEMEFEPASTVTLSSGTYRSTVATRFGGRVNASGFSGQATLTNSVSQTFESTSMIALTGDLRLDSPITIVQSGAAFLGGGLLTNNSGRTLQLLTGANVAVSLRNEGTLEIGASPGQASGLTYQQAATGSLHVELQGTVLGQFDRLSFTGTAQLAGSLDLTLLGGFVPALGNVFDILSANSGITGTFANVIQPDTMPIGLYLKPIYNLTLVQLMVVNQVPGDYNLNGVVDAADFVVWRKSDNSPGGYSLWRTNFGLTAAAAAASATANIAVPEANSLLLCWIAIALLCGHGVSKRRAYRSSLKYTLNEPSPALPPRGREYEKSVVKGMGVGYLIRRYLCQRIPRARPESALAA